MDSISSFSTSDNSQPRVTSTADWCSSWEPSQPSGDILRLLDIESLAKLQHSITGPVGRSFHLGSRSVGFLILGSGYSFLVRRVPYKDFPHSIDIWDEPFDKEKKNFVVVKQPQLKDTKGEYEITPENELHMRLQAVLMELTILYHEPIRKHPNIVKLHHFMWDT
jgi:hypothetical protein